MSSNRRHNVHRPALPPGFMLTVTKTRKAKAKLSGDTEKPGQRNPKIFLVIQPGISGARSVETVLFLDGNSFVVACSRLIQSTVVIRMMRHDSSLKRLIETKRLALVENNSLHGPAMVKIRRRFWQ
ncbi:hypothetical protein C8J56DRAFT_1039270 [Mycena floridula]|nr:hypothetical protein C8J56DRAFT_1039270 [Mycena floridula]